MIADIPNTADLSAAIHSTQVAMEHIRDDVAWLMAAVATAWPCMVIGSADEQWAAPPTARHLDHMCDHLVLAVRTLSEVERRTTDLAARKICRGALDRITCVKPGALEAA